MSPKLVNFLSQHTGKWYEVGTRCTNDPNEELEIQAKFIHPADAIAYAMRLVELPVYIVVVVR